MRNSTRTRFTMGMIFLFLIILVLSVFSGYYVNKLSKKTDAILKENYISVVYARDMAEGIRQINQELNISFLEKRITDSVKVVKELSAISNSLTEEKNNITEPGEANLVSEIDVDFARYQGSVQQIMRSPNSVPEMLDLEKKSAEFQNQLLMLSQMNGRAIETKTDDAKASAKTALTQMTILATLCFLIGMSFTWSFATYFNQRFFKLYNGIKEIVSSNFNKRLYFEGKDEFYDISLVFNEMAEKLKRNEQKMSVTLPSDSGKDTPANPEVLKELLFKLKIIEEQAEYLISRLEKK